MSTAEFPVEVERVSQGLRGTSSEQRQEIADTVTGLIASGPPEREPPAPDLLDMKGFLREEGDESERPGTTALMESREQDRQKDEELMDRLSSDE